MISRAQLIFIMLSVFMAWFLDVLSTWIGINTFGLHETNPGFLTYPWIWLVILECWILIVAFFKWAPLFIRKILLVALTLGSFYPALSNLYFMANVVMG